MAENLGQEECRQRKSQKILQIDSPLLWEKESGSLLAEGMESFGDRVDVKMLLNNRIPGILPLQIRYIDNEIIYSYQCREMISLEETLDNKMPDFSTVCQLFESICRWHQVCEEYFLQETHFILNASYVMWHIQKEEFFVCYFPGYDISFQKQLEEFCEFLLKKINHKDKKCTKLLYDAYDVIMGKGDIVSELEKCLQKYAGEEMEEKVFPSQQEREEKKTSSKEHETGWYLEKISKRYPAPKKIPLNQNGTQIGRNSQGAGRIPGMQISREHARLEWENGNIYLTDAGAGNGVFLNGNSLIKDHPVLCKEGDKISFADISYCLKQKGQGGA